MAEENNLEPERNDLGDDGGPVEPGSETSPAIPSEKALTPGQRLAAKKAQKAQKKKDFKEELKRKEEEQREQEQEEANRIFARRSAEPGLPEEVQKVAGSFTDFMQHNRGRILGGIVGFVAVSALVILGRPLLMQGSASQAEKLNTAVEIANAGVDATDSDGKTDDGKSVYKTRAERASKAAQAFAAAASENSDSNAATWAKLGEAAQKLSLGKAAEAQKLYEAVYAAHKGEADLGPRALEGIALALDASGKSDEAVKRFEELKASDDTFYKELAEFHLGRLKLARGDKDGAKALLKPLYDRLSDRPEGTPPSRYLRGEVEGRLAEIDSSLVDKGSSGSGDRQFSQEELQRLLEQMRSQQGGAPE